MQASLPAEDLKVLAHGIADGHRLELVQNAGGRLAILHDGHRLDGLNLTAAGFDQCVRLYLGMLRHRPQVDA